MEPLVDAFVEEDMYEEAKTSGFMPHDTEAPSSYSTEAWLNAETVEDSLDLGHNLVAAIDIEEGNMDGDRPREQAAILREAYKRHHPEFDVLAWTTNMGAGTGYDDKISGMMYSPNDDKIRSFSPTSGDTAFATEGNRGMHTEIQEWPILEEGHEDFHPLMFHTDEWNRQNPGFEYAKEELLSTVFDIATDTSISYANEGGESTAGILDNITATTGTAEQLSRTLAEYNNNDANFEDVWNLSSTAVGKYIEDPSINGIIDTVDPEEDDYDEYFGGGFGFYEVENEEIVEEVRQDRNGEYNNFVQEYDELETLS